MYKYEPMDNLMDCSGNLKCISIVTTATINGNLFFIFLSVDGMLRK